MAKNSLISKQRMTVILKREWKNTLHSPVSAIFVTIFLISLMGFTFILGRFYDAGEASLEGFFAFHPWLYLFLIPALGMRLWSEEKREGTIEILSTLPFTWGELVLGKFLAAWIWVGISLALTFPIVLTVFYLGSPDFGPMVTGYLGSWLMAGAYLAIMAFTSSLTRNQVISFVTGILVCLFFVLLGYGIFLQYLAFLPVGVREFLSNLGFITHFQRLGRGVVEFRDLAYFISVMAFFLLLNWMALESRVKAGLTAALAVGLISLNFMLSLVPWKLDLTAGKLYSLSDGSRKIVAAIDDEVTLKFFFSASSEGMPLVVKNYGRKVEEVLKGFVNLSSGNLKIEVIDPKPDTDEEEQAAKYGVSSVQSSDGDPFYFGLAILYQDQVHQIPFFDPRKESFLEYDVAALLTKLKSTGTKKLGLISGVPLEGNPQAAMMGQKQESWFFYSEIKKLYDVRTLDHMTLEEIPSDLDLLLVLHPRPVTEKLEYAIEQYLLKGGRAILIVDPSANSVPDNADPQMAMYGLQAGSQSNLPKVFATLGLEYNDMQVALDEQNAAQVSSQSGVFKHPGWLQFQRTGFNTDLVMTSGLESALFIEAGFFKAKEGTTFTPLITTSTRSGKTAVQQLRSLLTPGAQFEKTGESMAIAGMVSGKWKSSGKPKDSKLQSAHLDSGEGSALVIADVDFLANSYAFQVLNFFGQTIAQPQNHNLAFLANSLEFISGNPDLIQIRSKGNFTRPFTKLSEIQGEAQKKWFAVEQSLNQKVQSLQEELNRLQNQRADGGNLKLTPEQEEQIKKFKSELMVSKRERRDVRKNLRQDIERLGTWLTVLNMSIIPTFVLGYGLWTYRRRTRRAS